MSLNLGFYGKLPCFGDFIRSDNVTSVFAHFQTWLDDSVVGVLKATGQSDDQSFDRLPPLGMILRVNESHRAVAALCAPSHDKSGRRWPFTIFSEIPTEIYTQQFSMTPEIYRLFFQIGHNCLKEAEDCFGFDRQRNTEWMLGQGLRLDVAETRTRSNSFLNSTTLEGFVKTLKLPDGSAETILPNIIFSLLSARSDISDQFQAIFRFPLSTAVENHGLEIEFWCLLTEAVADIKFHNKTLMWTKDGFDIAFNSRGAGLLTTGWVPGVEDDNLWEFSKMSFDIPWPDESPFKEFAKFLESDQISLFDFLSAAREKVPSI